MQHFVFHQCVQTAPNQIPFVHFVSHIKLMNRVHMKLFLNRIVGCRKIPPEHSAATHIEPGLLLIMGRERQ